MKSERDVDVKPGFNRNVLHVETGSAWRPFRVNLDRKTSQRVVKLLREGRRGVRAVKITNSHLSLEALVGESLFIYLVIACLPKDHGFELGHVVKSKGGSKLHWECPTYALDQGCSGYIRSSALRQHVDAHEVNPDSLCLKCFWAFEGIDLRLRVLSRLQGVEGDCSLKEAVLKFRKEAPRFYRWLRRCVNPESTAGGLARVAEQDPTFRRLANNPRCTLHDLLEHFRKIDGARPTIKELRQTWWEWELGIKYGRFGDVTR